MIIFGDYHTHTKYSHGKGTVLDNAKVAEQKNLKEIAITDHGFKHELYGIKRKKWDKLREDCHNAEKETGIKVFVGVEANFISRDGTIDVTPEQYEQMDLVLCGHHNFVHAKTMGDKAMLFHRNMLSGIFKPSKKRIEKNTAVYLRAMEKNRIDVITHLNYGMLTNTLEVAKMARDTGTYIEFNGKRILFSEEEIMQMVDEKVRFIVNSDAHLPENVGEANDALYLLRKLDVPVDTIANINKLPIFKKGR